MPLFREADDLRGARRIPYPGLNTSFYSARQTLIPFLGAGASLPPPASASPRQPDPALVDAVCATIGVTHSTASAIIESAISAALRVQNGSPAQGSVRQ